MGIDRLSGDILNIINEHIADGLTTEQVCGVLDVMSYRVKQASNAPAESGGGSPVSKPMSKDDYKPCEET